LENDVIESAKRAIATAKADISPEACAKYQNQLNDFIDMSPNKVARACYLLQHINKDGLMETYLNLYNGCVIVKTSGRRHGHNRQTGNESQTSSDKIKSAGRSTKFSTSIKSNGICQVTGSRRGSLVSSHILPFSARQGDSPKIQRYLELVEALFGPDALQMLLINVLNGDKDTSRSVNRLDNGIAMQEHVHARWDAMVFSLEVLWDTYNPSTKEVIRHPHSESLAISLILYFAISSTLNFTGSLSPQTT
jgi:hypothetical protein